MPLVTAGKALSDKGSAVKNSFAMRARVSVSGNPAGMEKSAPGRVVVRSEPCFSGALFGGSFVVMVAADFYVFERGDRVIDQNRSRAVERNEIRSDGAGVDTHETDREAGSLFPGQSWLVQTDDALLL